MSVKSETSFIENHYSCNGCIDLGIALIKHQSKFHSKVHTNQTDILELLQNALIPNNAFDYNITISVIQIPINKKLKCEPELEVASDYEYTTALLSDHASDDDWLLKQEPDTILKIKTKSESSDDSKWENSVALRAYKTDKCKVQLKKRKYHSNRTKQQINFSRQKTYICDFCSTTFTLKRLLLRHLKQEHISKILPSPYSTRRKCEDYKCNQCNEVFTKLMFYRSHIRRIHPEQMLIRQKEKDENSVNLCDICGRGFDKINALYCHRRTHTKSRPYTCTICNKNFTLPTHLTEHMNVHAGKKIKCMHENCDREYSYQSAMTRHYKVCHTLNQDYQCEFCPKRFSVYTKLT